jgi:two-component system LytT family response regulator
MLNQEGGGDARRRKRANGQSTGTLIPSTPWRAARTPEHSVARFTRDEAEEPVLDLTQDDGGRASSGSGEARPLRVLVREGRRTRFVPLSDVDWFEADGNYILVHAAGEKYRTRGTITAIESALDPRQFVRIHRRIVVNMDRVREMSPLPGGDGLLMLGDGSTLRLSRTYRSRVR